MNKFISNIFFIILVILTLPIPLYADDVLTTIDEAVNQYVDGDYDGAASNLEYAAQLVRQNKSEALKKVFPDPFDGWIADPASSQSTGTAAFGRSISVSRTYSKEPATVTIEIASESPLMQSLLMMLNNPVFAGADGAKLELFDTYKGIVKYSETNKSGDISIVVEDRFVVSVKGQNIDRENLLAYAKAVKYSELSPK